MGRGNRSFGMVALEFLPEVAKTDKAEKIDVKSLADLAERIFIERENAHIMPEESITMQSLLTVGTSAGGRQPKAIIAINKATGEIRSGQVAGLQDYDYYILKFGDTKYSSAEIEMTYYEMAIKSGIDMMPSRLYEIDGNRNFITKRFDRDGERKLHTQTLAAISPETDSYEGLVAICRKLHLPETDCQEVFRRLVFNVLSNNTDQDRWVSSIESAINTHLVSWGLEDKGNNSAVFEIDGKRCTDVRIEQAYKGNFHLYASIDGRDCKFIIGKNKPEYATIQETGLSNLPESMLRDLVAKYLVR